MQYIVIFFISLVLEDMQNLASTTDSDQKYPGPSGLTSSPSEGI